MQRFKGVDPLAADYASWSPYNYVLNNPVLLTDPDGRAPVCETCKSFFKASVAYVAGAANAIASNFTGNAPGTRGNPADFNGYSEYAAAGQNAGDVLSVAIGTVEQVVGVVATVGGVIAAPETGGLSLTVSAAGTQAVVHGTTMSQAALQNLTGNNATVNMARKPVDRSGKNFTKKGKKEVIEANKQRHGGVNKCNNCKTPTVPSKKSMRGVTPPQNEMQVDHIIPKSKGGAGSPSNGQGLCRGCNRRKSNN